MAALDEIVSSEPGRAAARDERGVSALMCTLYQRRPDLAEVLRGAGVPLDLFEAAAVGDAARVAELLAGGGVAAWSPDGFTALHLAAFFGQDRVARDLLAAGADPGAVSRSPMAVQPLHSAAAGGHRRVVAALLEAGADPNARQHGGFTALHAAVARDDVVLVDLLLAHGADASLAADDGRAPAAFGTGAAAARLRER